MMLLELFGQAMAAATNSHHRPNPHLEAIQMKADRDMPSGTDPRNPSTTPSGTPRDPHPAWWIEHRQIAAELETWTYSHPGEPDLPGGDYHALCRRMNALDEKIFNTHVTSFEGCAALLDALQNELKDQGEPLLDEALHKLVAFLSAIRSGLDRHGRLREVELLLWESAVPSAPVWQDHPGVPADAADLWRAAHPVDQGDAS